MTSQWDREGSRAQRSSVTCKDERDTVGVSGGKESRRWSEAGCLDSKCRGSGAAWFLAWEAMPVGEA